MEGRGRLDGQRDEGRLVHRPGRQHPEPVRRGDVASPPHRTSADQRPTWPKLPTAALVSQTPRCGLQVCTKLVCISPLPIRSATRLWSPLPSSCMSERVSRPETAYSSLREEILS